MYTRVHADSFIFIPMSDVESVTMVVLVGVGGSSGNNTNMFRCSSGVELDMCGC